MFEMDQLSHFLDLKSMLSGKFYLGPVLSKDNKPTSVNRDTWKNTILNLK